MKFIDSKIHTLPDMPGVYFFLKGKKILYIGKATSLRSRVKSYFLSDITETRGPRIVKMLEEATGVRVEKTDSVLEALILEAVLIKKHQPKYNAKEKSDTSFNYVVITFEQFPRVFTIRHRELLQNQILNIKYQKTFGPFPYGTQLQEALKIIRKIFPYRGKTDAPLATDRRRASRLYEEIGLSPQSKNITPREYKKTIRHIVLFFEGKKKQLIRAITRDMKAYARTKQFEMASEMKRRLYALQHIQDVSLLKATSYKLQATNSFRIEAYDVAHISGTARVGVMTVVENGESNKKEYRTFTIKTHQKGDTAGLAEILERRLNHNEWQLPKLIVVDGGIAQKNTAEKVLKTFGYQIPVVAVTKNERHRPEKLLGNKEHITEYGKEILLANNEAHRFAISTFRKKTLRLH
ncbi:MAG: GIY-YIG nuclease family protein [Candidatus Campbellbacteria bacterium]|nr:GIY-YIG nuclease family protein [Candidatus Campbellbacteria bacterium]